MGIPNQSLEEGENNMYPVNPSFTVMKVKFIGSKYHRCVSENVLHHMNIVMGKLAISLCETIIYFVFSHW